MLQLLELGTLVVASPPTDMLPAATSIADFGITYVFPEIIRVITFGAGVALVIYFGRRMLAG